MTFLQSLFGLEGRVALVGGGSRGLGAAIAAGLSRAGAAVTALGRSDSCDAAGVDYRSCDLRDAEAFAAACAQVAERGGRLDVYVHAAGITRPEADQSLETFSATIESNLTACYACCRTASRHMTREGGAIVLVTSIGGQLAFPGNPAYAASKGGMRAMARALALDLAPRGIRVNAVAPGYVRTAMTEASYQVPETRRQREERTMLGRWGEPDEIVGGVIYLASNAASYVTAHELVIDGGWTARGL